MDYLALGRKISAWLQDYLQGSGLQCFVVGVSGGIDSAVVSTLAAETGTKTYVLNLPIRSKPENTQLADLHCRSLTGRFPNVLHLEQDFSSAYEAFMRVAEPSEQAHGLSAANTKSRLRMTALYYVAGKNSGIVVGTGNKVEDFGVGFFTKYGDGGVDISPIADLSKTQVRELAKVQGVSPEIIAAPPTDGLWEDSRNDEQQIGAGYEELEWAMSAAEQSLSPGTEREKQVWEIYSGFHRRNLHKMEAIPVFRLKS
ncbi:NAD(+) synthase [Candidatus Haliotispira prima]|uniref:NH(3)-dependent NAD(+) synthetase n=1 Tax=Candidatus Haliotispira prima TaxID=3034016 RepID=A0ABY8MJR1_9SPIO|nr:NAD(+) synthase [Candidatus Haliotispira prima]